MGLGWLFYVWNLGPKEGDLCLMVRIKSQMESLCKILAQVAICSFV